MCGQIIGLPEETGIFKVVQIYLRDSPVLLFGPQNKGHGLILLKYLVSQGIDFKEEEPYVPEPTGDLYRVCGGGGSAVLVSKGQMRFSGKSLHYDMKIDTQHLDRIEELRDWNVKID